MKIFGLNITRERRNLEQPSISYEQQVANALNFPFLNFNESPYTLSAFHRCVELISSSVANLPISVLFIDKQGNKKQRNNHRLNVVFQNMLLTRYQFIHNLVKDVITSGNAFAYIHRDNGGNVKQITYMQPTEVQVVYNKQKGELYYQIPSISKQKIESYNIIHLVQNSKDGIVGTSTLSLMNRTLKGAGYAETTALNLFENNGQSPRGILTVESQLSAKQREDIKEKWASNLSSNGVCVLQGNMRYQSLSATANDQQLLESRKFHQEQICQFMGVPPELLGMKEPKNIEELTNQFLMFTLQPIITLIEEEFTRKLFAPSEKNFRIDLDENSMLRMSKSAQAAYYSTLLQNGCLSINEVRNEIGFESIGQEGDRHFVAYSDLEQNTINNSDTQEENEGTEGKGN
jgi:phage portal protein, HK97 family|nr:MAG TPA: portal protein [Caudoviricetes sp.]